MRKRRDLQTAVVTGPTGSIGVALCKRLLQEQITVYAVCNPNSSRKHVLPSGVHIVECDLQELAQLPQKIEETVDAFFHFAWAKTMGAGRNDMHAQVGNIQGTLAAAEAACRLGCQVFIGAGSQAEYGRVEGLLQEKTPCFPENGYGMAKLCAGQMSRVQCHEAGVDHVWARILSVYGPYDNGVSMISGTIRTLMAGGCPGLTKGEQLWDYLYSEDAADAFYRMALWGQDGAVYPVGSGQVHPLRSYVEQLRDSIDPALPLNFGAVAYAPQQVMHLQADISRLTEDTGFEPQTTFQKGIKKTIEWVRRDKNER